MVQYCPLQFSTSQAALLTSVYWGLFALGRLSAVPLSLVLAPLTMTVFDLVGAIVSIVVLFSLPENGSIDHLSLFYLFIIISDSKFNSILVFVWSKSSWIFNCYPFFVVSSDHSVGVQRRVWIFYGVDLPFRFWFQLDVFSCDESASITWFLIVKNPRMAWQPAMHMSEDYIDMNGR
jgi:hypothetical protein